MTTRERLEKLAGQPFALYRNRVPLDGDLEFQPRGEAIVADISKFVDKDCEGMDFKELAECPVAAIQGLSEGDAEKLNDAFNVKTIQDLADNKFVRIAQATTTLSH